MNNQRQFKERGAEAARVLREAEARGWVIRPGARAGVLVAERGSSRYYGAGPSDLANNLWTVR